MAVASESLPARLARRMGLEPQELGTLALMGALIGTLFCGYTLAKVLRDALFLSEYGALALPYAYIAVALVSGGFVWLEGAIARRFTRLDPMRFNQVLAMAIGATLSFAYTHYRHWTAAALYLWTGSQAMLLLSHFWVLALDVWDSRRARRVFPVLSGFGLIGGLLGGAIAAWLTPVVRRNGLAWIVTLLIVLAYLLTQLIELGHRRHPRLIEARSTVSRWEIVRRSSYIKVFVIGLALSVIVSTLVDFQFKYFIQRLYPDPHRLAEFLGIFYVVLNSLALLFQFGAAGWLLQRIGLGASTGLQPTTVLVFALWMILGTGGWIIVAMRWVQGVVFQTLGKSSSEIYFTAIRPNERRRIKPAIDTLVERWSDAAVGILLLLVLHALRMPFPAIAVLTAALAAVWLVVLLRLDRRYARAFELALSRRWIEPEEAAELMRLPSARRAIWHALHDSDERRVVLALQLAQRTRDRATIAAVRECLDHSSPSVRAAAILALEAVGARDPEARIDALLLDPNEVVRRAAVSYRLTRGPNAVEAARLLLAGNDPVVRRHVLEVMLDHPQAGRALSWSWIEARLQSESAEDHELAALALGVLPGRESERRLRGLLGDPDPEVRRAALQSAAHRPMRRLLDDLLPLLLDRDLSHEARQAVARVGGPAVSALRSWLQDRHGPPGQAVAARTLAEIGSPPAIGALLPLVRSRDVWLRHLGLQALVQTRLRSSQPLLSRSGAHLLFLRELRDYRDWLEPARALASHPAPEVKLLAESYEESAGMALERGIQALACAYEARPLLGALERLRSGNPEAVSPALEYLSHLLPGRVFRRLSQAFERPVFTEEESARLARPLAEWIRQAWSSDDPWLRACAARASRHAPDLDVASLVVEDQPPEIVRLEVAARMAFASPRSEARAC